MNSSVTSDSGGVPRDSTGESELMSLRARIAELEDQLAGGHPHERDGGNEPTTPGPIHESDGRFAEETPYYPEDELVELPEDPTQRRALVGSSSLPPAKAAAIADDDLNDLVYIYTAYPVPDCEEISKLAIQAVAHIREQHSDDFGRNFMVH